MGGFIFVHFYIHSLCNIALSYSLLCDVFFSIFICTIFKKQDCIIFTLQFLIGYSVIEVFWVICSFVINCTFEVTGGVSYHLCCIIL